MGKADTPAGDVFEMRDDGTVVIGWDGVQATLRRPTVGEWLSFMEQSEAADAWIRNEPDPSAKAAEPAKARTFRDLMGPDGPYLALYQRLLAELGDVKVDREQMAPWLADGSVFADVSRWWRTSPLLRKAAAPILTPSR